MKNLKNKKFMKNILATLILLGAQGFLPVNTALDTAHTAYISYGGAYGDIYSGVEQGAFGKIFGKGLSGSVLSFFEIGSKCYAGPVWNIENGIYLLGEKKYEDAAKFFEGYVKSSPNDPEGHYYLGLCYKNLNKADKSVYHLQKSYELSKNIEKIKISEGSVLSNGEGSPKNGVQEGTSPEDDYLDMANMYLESGNLSKALGYADLMLNYNPNSINGLILKTKILYKQNNPAQAKIYFQKALMLDNSLIKSVWAKNLNVTNIPEYDFNYYNTKGLEYYYSGDLGGAVNYFKKAVGMSPKNQNALANAYNNLALAYMKQNNLAEAKNALNSALRADKNFNLTYINLAKLEGLKAAQYKQNGGREKESFNKQREKYLKKALNVNPNSKYAYLELGNYYLEEKKYDLARENFKNAVLIDGDFFEGLMGLGISHIEEGNLDEGIKVLRKAASVGGDGISGSLSGKNAGNKGVLGGVSGGTSGRASGGKGGFGSQRGSFSAQDGTLGAQGGKNPDLLYYLARVCVANASYDEAKGYILDALKICENKNYYFELGKIYYAQDDFASAQNAFNKAMELDLDFELEGDIYNYLGLIEYKNFDTDKAVYMFKKAVDIDPKRAMYLYNLAQAYRSLGNKNEYAKEIDAIASLKPKTVQDFIDFSTIYYDKKNTATAIKILETGINKYPEERSLYEAKLKLHKASHDTAGVKSTEALIKAKFGK